MSQPFYLIVSNAVPTSIYVSASVITYMTLASIKDDFLPFLNLLRLSCVVFAVARVLVVAYTWRGGISLLTSRYELLSSAIIPSLAVVAMGLMQRLSMLDFIALVVNLVIALASVTRTLFVALIAQVASVFLARPSVAFRASAFKGLLVLSLAMLLLVVLDLSAGTGLTTRWIQRTTISRKLGADPTALTRSAETHFMLESFESSEKNALFGSGLAALTSLTGPDAAQAVHLTDRNALIHSIGFGHEDYVSILFVAGLVGGGGFLLILFLNGLQSISLIRRLELEQVTAKESAAHIARWGALIVLGELTIGFLGPTLGDRDTCLWWGIGTGILYWARSEFYPRR